MTNLEFYKDEIIENINEFNVIGLSITFVYKKYSNKEYSTLVDVINWLLTEDKEPYLIENLLNNCEVIE